MALRRQHATHFDELLELVFEGPLEDEPWRTFLTSLSRAVDARGSVLILRPPDTADSGLLGFTHWPDAVDAMRAGELSQNWAERLYVEDPLRGIPVGIATTVGSLIPVDRFRASRFYAEFMAPMGLLHQLGVDGRDSDGFEVRLRAGRGSEAPDFGRDERRLFEDLLPHVRRAARLHHRITWEARQQRLYAQTLDHLGIGVIVLDERGMVRDLNTTATAILADQRGLRMSEAGLSAERDDDAATFQDHVQRLIRGHAAGLDDSVAMRIRSATNGEVLHVVLRTVPVPAWDKGQERPAIAVFVHASRQLDVIRVDVVSGLFGLTQAESRLAVCLMQGMTLVQAAESLSVTRNTARNQLQSVFSKVGVSRQADLVRLLLRGVAHVA